MAAITITMDRQKEDLAGMKITTREIEEIEEGMAEEPRMATLPCQLTIGVAKYAT